MIDFSEASRPIDELCNDLVGADYCMEGSFRELEAEEEPVVILSLEENHIDSVCYVKQGNSC